MPAMVVVPLVSGHGQVRPHGAMMGRPSVMLRMMSTTVMRGVSCGIVSCGVVCCIASCGVAWCVASCNVRAHHALMLIPSSVAARATASRVSLGRRTYRTDSPFGPRGIPVHQRL